MKNFFVIANEEKQESIILSEKIKDYIEKKQCRVKCVTGYVRKEMIEPETECIIVLGGDGTLLNAARELKDTDIPLLGINLGHLGFLAEVEKDNIFETIDKLLDDAFTVEPRMMLVGDIVRDNNIIAKSVALNDIVVGRAGVLSVMDFNMYVNGLHLNSYKADGIIVATPTGSTAYSMSAGGPIVKPSANLIVITPVCPHTLNTRSIILESTDVVEIEVTQSKKCHKEIGYAYFDGENMCSLVPGDKIVIRKSNISTKIIKLSSVGFLEILGKKMGNNENGKTK